MRLHCSWVVLVAIVWTIQLRNSASESIKNESTGRLVEKPSNELKISVSGYNNYDVNSTDHDLRDRLKNETDSTWQTTDTQIIMKSVAVDDVIGNTVQKIPLPDYTLKIINTLDSVSNNNTDGNDFSGTPDSKYFDKDHYGVVQPISQNPGDLTSSKENTAPSQGTIDGGNSSKMLRASKAQKAMDMKTDDPTASVNRSPHDTTEHPKLPTAARKSKIVMQRSEEDFHDTMPSTAEYSSETVKFMGFSSPNINNFTSILTRNGSGSSSSIDDSKSSSEHTKSVVSLIGNHGKDEEQEVNERNERTIVKAVQDAIIDQAQERSIIDRTMINITKPNSLEKMLATDKFAKAVDTNTDETLSPSKKQLYDRRLNYFGTTRSSIEMTNLQREHSNRAAISNPVKNNRGITLSPLARRPTDFHIGLVSRKIALGLSDKRIGKSFELPAEHSLNVDASFSENNLANGWRRSLARIPSQPNPHPTISSQTSKNHQWDAVKDIQKKLQNPVEMNYSDPRKNKREYYLTSGMTSRSSEIKGEKATITSGNKAKGNKVSPSGRYGSRMDNVKRMKLTDMLGKAGEFHHKVQLDNGSNQDSGNEYSNFRSVVKNTLTHSQMKNGDHKILISPATREIDFQQQQQHQLRQEMQDQEKSNGKLIAEMDSMKKNRFPNLKNETTAIENSTRLSLAVGMQRGSNVLESISSVTPKRARKIGLSANEPNDTRDSWIMKVPRKHFIILRAAKVLEPLGSQKLQRTDDERLTNNLRGDNLIKKNPVDFIRKIDNPATSDSLLPTNSSYAELHQKNSKQDDDRSRKKYDRGDGNETTKEFRLQWRRQQSKAFPYQNVRISDTRKKSAQPFGRWSKTVDDNDVGVTPDDKKKRKCGEDRIVEATIATDTRDFKPSVFPLLTDRNDAITDVTYTKSPDKKYVEEDRNVEAKDEFSKQSNYIRKVKIDGTSSVSTVNRLELRDSTVVNVDASEIRREARNDIAEKTSTVEPCEPCKIVQVVESTRSRPVITYKANRDDHVVGVDDIGHRGQSEDKIKQSIKLFGNSKNANHARITKTNGIPVVPISSSSDVSSLSRPSAKFILIDRLKPEARVYRRMHQVNREIVVRDQDPIFVKPKAENLIPSRESEAHQPLSSEKLTLSNDALTSESMVHILNDKVQNSSSVHQHAKAPQPFSQTKSFTHNKLKHEPLISGLPKSFTRPRISSHDEFLNNAVGIPWDHENFNTYSTFQTRSPSGGGRRRKSVGHEQETDSWTSLTKIDSNTNFSIDRSPDNDRSPINKVLLPHSHLGVSATRYQDETPPNNRSVEQIERGFTNVQSTSIPVAAPTLTSSYSHANSITTAISENRDIGSTESIKQATSDVVTGFELTRAYPTINDIGKSLNTVYTHPREIVESPVVELSSDNPVILSTSGQSFMSSLSSSFVRDNSLMMSSANLQQSQSNQTLKNTVSIKGNIQTFDYTANDNSTRTTATLNQWPVKYSAVVEGDLVLGGLMMVHEREDSVTCGPVMPQGGVQALEAMLYTLDWVNKQDLVPGVKIGAHILDDCDKDTYGLEMAVDFIKGSISNIDGAEYHCNKTAVRKVISGVVGAASSVTSIQVANLLRLFRIPQVSFFSTSPELSNKMRFEYFTRTIPSDHYQVKAMVDIVLVMGWSYVSIIYEESNYGEKAYEELEKLLGKHQICIAVKEKLSKDSGVAKAHVYDNIVLKLLTKPRARGCIIFASDQEVAGVMKAVRRCNATGAFSWIGSDGWSARSLVSDGNEPEMEGTLSVQPQANPVEGFEDYFLNLTVENNRRNPWFVEFWEDHFKCRYPNASQTPYNNYTEECTTTEKLTKQNTAFENQLQYVSDAVMAFAYAFRNMHIDLCHGIRGLCDAMKPTKGTELLSYLRRVQFKGLSGDVFHFDKNGDGPARYNIIHFKQVSPGKYKWIRVGKYLEGELRLNMSDNRTELHVPEIQFRLGHPQPPESVCSLPCEVGQAKKYVEGESCCWHCFNCTQYQIRHESDEKQCVLCPQGTVPDETHSYCRDIPENFLRPESGWAIGAMSFSSTGILITLFVGGVFLKHNDTPIVRASGRELSYVLLTGILLCYLVTFALVLRPNDLVCSIQRFSAGFCFTVVYAALLTKTNRISRIFNAGKHSAKRPSFISPRSQLIICSMLVAVQILINGVWMVIDPAKAMHHYPTREDNLLVCNSYIDASYMIAFTYPIILIVVCTVYAVLTRKIPEAFNESKHIGFTMYTTCVIWLAFVPLYFGTGSQVALRITSMSVTISLSASVTIACLFTPKLYIILIHPERNVRPNMMKIRYNTTKGSVVTATNASSMMAPVTLTAITCDQNKAVKKHVITTMDCSTQSEQFEMEAKDQKNGKFAPAVITRSTQTLLNNNGKESEAVTSPVIKDIIIEETFPSTKGLNKAKIGNGPLSQNDVPL